MSPELEDRLVRRFPLLYRGVHKDMRQTAMCWGFECGDGWFSILWMLSLAIEAELNVSPLRKWWILFSDRHDLYGKWNSLVLKIDILEPKSQLAKAWSKLVSKLYRHQWFFEVTQVKEKYGTLSFYHQGGNDMVDDMVSAAERASEHTCEKCGGWVTKTSDVSGWYVTLCDEHLKEYIMESGYRKEHALKLLKELLGET